MKTTTLILATLALTCGALAQEKKEHTKAALESLMERMHDARAAGRLDEARELAEQAKRLRTEQGGHEDMKKPGQHPEGGRPPEAERMEHVMQAVQHLRAAGLHEQARGVEEMARHMRQEMEEQMKRQQAEAREREGKPHSGMKVEAEVAELRQQMRKMAEQIEMLQAELKKRGQ